MVIAARMHTLLMSSSRSRRPCARGVATGSKALIGMDGKGGLITRRRAFLESMVMFDSETLLQPLRLCLMQLMDPSRRS